MKTTFKDAQLAIVDDVLGPEQFAQTWRAFQDERYDSVHAKVRSSVFRLQDGNPLRGQEFYRTLRPLGELLPPGVDPKLLAGLKLYPTGTAFDFVADEVMRMGAEVGDVVGRPGVDWVAISFVPFVYSAGSGLSWHSDDTLYSGSFTYYGQPEWSPFWGGELLVADESIHQREAEAFEAHRAGPLRPRPHFREMESGAEAEFSHLREIGHGRFVQPKPNRLALLNFGALHMVSAIHPAAGNHVRASITGFFLRPEGVKRLIERQVAPK